MKKRLLSALLALALVFVLLPTTALAGETTGSDYDISINGKGWKFDKEDNSDAYIPVYFYGNDPSRYFFSTEVDDQWASNSNLMLTKEGNTVTITIRPKKNHIPGNTIEFTLEKKSTTSGSPYDYTPCIEMGNNNNLVITGKGTLNITRDEKNGIGAALCSEVGDITITDGITVKANFLKQVSNSTTGNAISIKDHNLIISGKNTKVEAKNSSCNFQDLYDVSATVCVENGEIKVSDGATLSAINNFTNSYTSQYSYYSRAISGSSSNPCTLTVTGENSCVIAKTDNSLGKAYGHVNFSIDGAKIEVGTSSPAQTITDINNISNYKYAKISVPALEKDSYVYIAGGPAVVGQKTSLGEGKGYYTYNATTKTLTLEDATISSGTNAIQFKAAGTYTVNLEGTNTISNVSRGILAKSANQNITGNINVILSGSGSLDISAKGRAIEVPSGNLTFNNTGAITLATTNTTVGDMNAINVSGKISIGNDFNRNLKITADNGAATFDPTNQYTVYNDLKNYKSISFSLKDSTISYGNKTLKQGETIKDENDGTATVATDGNTITLNNFKGDKALVFNAEFTPNSITLIGDSTLSAVETKYQSLTISGSGSGSLTAGSIKVHKEKSTSTTGNTIPNLTITGGAQVTVNRPSNEDLRAIDIDGDLTVTNGSLTATSTSTKPTVQVGGNATFTGSTVTITNNSTEPHKDAADATKGDSVSSALCVKGNINITDNATVTAKVENGGGNAIGAVGNITVNGSTVTAVNKGQKFTTIIAKNVYVSGESTITANNLNGNPPYNGSYLAFPAIEGNIVNQNTDYSLKFEGQHNRSSVPKTTLAPGEQTTLYYYNVTITCGDKVTRTNSPVVIAGTTLLNDTPYTITNGSKVAEGTDSSNYNAFYDSETKTLKLNNASINGTGVKAIEANVGGYTFTIELVGNNIIKTSGFANNVIDITGNLYFTGSGTAEVSGKGTPIYATYKIDVSADVTITNTEKAGSFTFSAYGENSSNYKGANTFAIGTGYTAYATTDKTTWAVYDNTTASENESYTTLRITTQPPETGGGSTHQHVWDEAWHDTGDYHHAHQCTICKAYDTTTQELHNVTGHRDNHDGSHSNICGSCGYSAKVSHSYTWAPNANDNEKHIGTCVCGNVVEKNHNFVGDVCSDCGYDKSTGTTCEHVWTTEWTIDTVDNEYHWHKCIKCNAITDKKPHAYTIVTDSGTNHIRECECKVFYVEDHISSDWIIDTPATATTAGSMHKECTVCKHKMQTEVIPATGEIEPPTPDNPGTIVIIRPAEEEKPAQQPNPSTGANDLVGLAVAAAVAAALGSAALLRKHD